MWTKKSGCSCLIFFLVIFIGNATISQLIGASQKKAKTLDDYQKHLCEGVRKAKDKTALDNFISRVSGVMTVSDLEYLPGYLRYASIKKIKQFEENLRSCKNHLMFDPENKKKELSKVVKERINKIDRVLRGIVKILKYVKQEENLAYDIRVLYGHLQPLRSLHLKRLEWPPESQQFREYGDYWQILEGIVKYQRRYYRIIDNKNKKLHEIPGATDKLKNERQRICELILQLRTIKSYLGRMDKDFRYYSWTETRVSVDKILELLEDKTLKKICSKN